MADPLRPSGPQIPGSLMGEIQSEVAVEATPQLSFVLRNSRIIVTCIVLLVLVIAGVGGWQWHQTRVAREARLELGRIHVSTQGPERIAALETFLPAAPSAMKSGVQLEIATTALGLEQYGKAAEAYAAVAAADPKGSIGMMAAINQADLLQRQGKYAEALAVFDSLEKSAPESLRPAILEGQNPNVDAVSGATYSSTGILNAVKLALAKAAVAPAEKTAPEQTASEETAEETAPSEAAEPGETPVTAPTVEVVQPEEKSAVPVWLKEVWQQLFPADAPASSEPEPASSEEVLPTSEPALPPEETGIESETEGAAE